MFIRFLLAMAVLLLPAMAEAADITGVPKIREGDHIQIGNTRIRLGGIDAPSVDQLCLNPKGERWTCGVAARDDLIKHADNKTWTCHTRQVTDRRGRTVARCEVDGEDIQKWLVRNGWALAYARFPHDYEPDEKTGRALARLHHQGQRQPLRRMHLSSADQPLVRADQDAHQQGHALVLFGR